MLALGKIDDIALGVNDGAPNGTANGLYDGPTLALVALGFTNSVEDGLLLGTDTGTEDGFFDLSMLFVDGELVLGLLLCTAEDLYYGLVLIDGDSDGNPLGYDNAQGSHVVLHV